MTDMKLNESTTLGKATTMSDDQPYENGTLSDADAIADDKVVNVSSSDDQTICSGIGTSAENLMELSKFTAMNCPHGVPEETGGVLPLANEDLCVSKDEQHQLHTVDGVSSAAQEADKEISVGEIDSDAVDKSSPPLSPPPIGFGVMWNPAATTAPTGKKAKKRASVVRYAPTPMPYVEPVSTPSTESDPAPVLDTTQASNEPTITDELPTEPIVIGKEVHPDPSSSTSTAIISITEALSTCSPAGGNVASVVDVAPASLSASEPQSDSVTTSDAQDETGTGNTEQVPRRHKRRESGTYQEVESSAALFKSLQPATSGAGSAFDQPAPMPRAVRVKVTGSLENPTAFFGGKKLEDKVEATKKPIRSTPNHTRAHSTDPSSSVWDNIDAERVDTDAESTPNVSVREGEGSGALTPQRGNRDGEVGENKNSTKAVKIIPSTSSFFNDSSKLDTTIHTPDNCITCYHYAFSPGVYYQYHLKDKSSRVLPPVHPHLPFPSRVSSSTPESNASKVDGPASVDQRGSVSASSLDAGSSSVAGWESGLADHAPATTAGTAGTATSAASSIPRRASSVSHHDAAAFGDLRSEAPFAPGTLGASDAIDLFALGPPPQQTDSQPALEASSLFRSSPPTHPTADRPTLDPYLPHDESVASSTRYDPSQSLMPLSTPLDSVSISATIASAAFGYPQPSAAYSSGIGMRSPVGYSHLSPHTAPHMSPTHMTSPMSAHSASYTTSPMAYSSPYRQTGSVAPLSTALGTPPAASLASRTSGLPSTSPQAFLYTPGSAAVPPLYPKTPYGSSSASATSSAPHGSSMYQNVGFDPSAFSRSRRESDAGGNSSAQRTPTPTSTTTSTPTPALTPNPATFARGAKDPYLPLLPSDSSNTTTPTTAAASTTTSGKKTKHATHHFFIPSADTPATASSVAPSNLPVGFDPTRPSATTVSRKSSYTESMVGGGYDHAASVYSTGSHPPSGESQQAFLADANAVSAATATAGTGEYGTEYSTEYPTNYQAQGQQEYPGDYQGDYSAQYAAQYTEDPNYAYAAQYQDPSYANAAAYDTSASYYVTMNIRTNAPYEAFPIAPSTTFVPDQARLGRPQQRFAVFTPHGKLCTINVTLDDQDIPRYVLALHALGDLEPKSEQVRASKSVAPLIGQPTSSMLSSESIALMEHWPGPICSNDSGTFDAVLPSLEKVFAALESRATDTFFSKWDSQGSFGTLSLRLKDDSKVSASNPALEQFRLLWKLLLIRLRAFAKPQIQSTDNSTPPQSISTQYFLSTIASEEHEEIVSLLKEIEFPIELSETASGLFELVSQTDIASFHEELKNVLLTSPSFANDASVDCTTALFQNAPSVLAQLQSQNLWGMGFLIAANKGKEAYEKYAQEYINTVAPSRGVLRSLLLALVGDYSFFCASPWNRKRVKRVFSRIKRDPGALRTRSGSETKEEQGESGADPVSSAGAKATSTPDPLASPSPSAFSRSNLTLSCTSPGLRPPVSPSLSVLMSPSGATFCAVTQKNIFLDHLALLLTWQQSLLALIQHGLITDEVQAPLVALAQTISVETGNLTVAFCLLALSSLPFSDFAPIAADFPPSNRYFVHAPSSSDTLTPSPSEYSTAARSRWNSEFDGIDATEYDYTPTPSVQTAETTTPVPDTPSFHPFHPSSTAKDSASGLLSRIRSLFPQALFQLSLAPQTDVTDGPDHVASKEPVSIGEDLLQQFLPPAEDLDAMIPTLFAMELWLASTDNVFPVTFVPYLYVMTYCYNQLGRSEKARSYGRALLQSLSQHIPQWHKPAEYRDQSVLALTPGFQCACFILLQVVLDVEQCKDLLVPWKETFVGVLSTTIYNGYYDQAAYASSMDPTTVQTSVNGSYISPPYPTTEPYGPDQSASATITAPYESLYPESSNDPLPTNEFASTHIETASDMTRSASIQSNKSNTSSVPIAAGFIPTPKSQNKLSKNSTKSTTPFPPAMPDSRRDSISASIASSIESAITGSFVPEAPLYPDDDTPTPQVPPFNAATTKPTLEPGFQPKANARPVSMGFDPSSYKPRALSNATTPKESVEPDSSTKGASSGTALRDSFSNVNTSATKASTPTPVAEHVPQPSGSKSPGRKSYLAGLDDDDTDVFGRKSSSKSVGDRRNSGSSGSDVTTKQSSSSSSANASENQEKPGGRIFGALRGLFKGSSESGKGKVADLGITGSQHYYDEARGKWVFPGEEDTTDAPDTLAPPPVATAAVVQDITQSAPAESDSAAGMNKVYATNFQILAKKKQQGKQVKKDPKNRLPVNTFAFAAPVPTSSNETDAAALSDSAATNSDPNGAVNTTTPGVAEEAPKSTTVNSTNYMPPEDLYVPPPPPPLPPKYDDTPADFSGSLYPDEPLYPEGAPVPAYGTSSYVPSTTQGSGGITNTRDRRSSSNAETTTKAIGFDPSRARGMSTTAQKPVGFDPSRSIPSPAVSLPKATGASGMVDNVDSVTATPYSAPENTTSADAHPDIPTEQPPAAFGGDLYPTMDFASSAGAAVLRDSGADDWGDYDDF